MIIAQKDKGLIYIEVEHVKPDENHWKMADKDADEKCRGWGYRKAYPTATLNLKYRRVNVREYECRNTSPIENTGNVTKKPKTDSIKSRKVGSVVRRQKHGCIANLCLGVQV